MTRFRTEPQSPLTDLNRRPLPYHGSALPTELRGRNGTRIATPTPALPCGDAGASRRRWRSGAAERRDAAGIRAIYNHYVNHSTTLFDMVPRTLDEQVQWIDEHSGGHPALVAEPTARIVGFGSLSPFRSRPPTHHGRGLRLPARRPPGPGHRPAAARGAAAAGRGPRLPLGDRPHHRRERRLDRAPRAPAASRSWAPSGRSAGSSASGSTWSRCSGCSEHEERPPSRRAETDAEWAGLDSNQRSLRSRFTACPLWPLGYRPGAAYSIRPPVPRSQATTLRRRAHAHVRRRVRARHARGPQRGRPGARARSPPASTSRTPAARSS